MPRVNEHRFELNNEQYLLTWIDKPRLTKNGIEQKVLPVLIQYIRVNNLPIPLVNSKGNNEVTHTLSKKILQHFSENTSTVKKRTQVKGKKEKKKKESVQSITNNEELSLSANFKVVMVCAGRKNNSFFTAYPNENFVNESTNNSEHHPDAIMAKGKISWREYLINNQNDKELLEAYNLYTRQEYRSLYNRFKERFYILSAGWGLVKADYKLPNYDITFSMSEENRNKRIFNDEGYKDFNQVDLNDKEDVLFFGGKAYLKLFYNLTQGLDNRKIIFYCGVRPIIPKRVVNPSNFYFVSYESKNKRGWYYEAVCDL